jgi:beta-fructofuranosidase
MTVAHTQEYAVVFYGSPNLKEWTELSRFKTSGFLGYQYECPGLVQVPIEGGPDDGKKLWVLFISINPGAPLGGSAVQYFIGDWNGEAFIPRDTAARAAEFSKDWYAFQSWDGSPDGKLYGIAWASNWQYSQVVPTSTFRSFQSLPRELALTYYRPNPLYGDWQLVNRPVSLAGITDKVLYSFADDNAVEKATMGKTVDLEGDGGFDIEATFLVPATANITYNSIGSLEIISSKGKERIITGIQMGEPAVLYIDRSNAGKWGNKNPFFTDKTSAILRYDATFPNDRHILGPIALSPFDLPTAEQPSGRDQTIKLRAVVDRTILEVFGNDGLVAGTNTFFFSHDGVPARLRVSLGDGQIRLKDLTVKSVRSTWRH